MWVRGGKFTGVGIGVWYNGARLKGPLPAGFELRAYLLEPKDPKGSCIVGCDGQAVYERKAGTTEGDPT